MLEELGYLHRKTKTCLPSSNGLGLLARHRPPLQRASPVDNKRCLREWRERQRRSAMVAEMSDKLAEITQFIANDQRVPQRLWTELDRTVRAPHLRLPQPDPGPGAYLCQRSLPPRRSAPAYTFGELLDRGRNFEKPSVRDSSRPKEASRLTPTPSCTEDSEAHSSCRSLNGGCARTKLQSIPASHTALPRYTESPSARNRHDPARHSCRLGINHPYIRYTI